MEKNSYETYEFLASTNSDSDSNQFFVLQDDGTILTVNKEIQYITKAENEKDVSGNLNLTEGCAPVFDIPNQQYYVEFQGNSTEMISLNDQYAITNGENSVISYNTNNYIIQPETTQTIEQMDTETLIDPQTLDAQQMQQLNVEAFNGTKQTTDLTEITLTDEQYHILEKKGWLLLESNDKIFVLNTLGLHDITSNDKLIQRLKNELQESTDTNSSIGQLKIESISSILLSESADVTTQEQGSVVEYFIANNVPGRQLEAAATVRYVIDDKVTGETNENAPKLLPEPCETNVTEVPVSFKTWNNADQNSETQAECDTLRIKTKYTFKDIPEKIFLGKTVNGKKLYAKVKKKSNKIQDKKIDHKPHYNSTLLDGAIFTNLIQESFRHLSKASTKQVAYAQAVVSQILRLPNIKHSIVGHNLVITKLITNYSESGKDIGQPTMVTGAVQQLGGEDTFVHSPLMLQELLHDAEEKSKTATDASSCPEEKTARGLVELFHIHISETKYSDKPAETSINLCERKLPLDVLNDAKKRHPNPAYACGTCGAVFTSEMQLKDHQDDECIEVEDELTIDTDDYSANISTLYTVQENGKEKVYSCTLCDTKFTRLFNCKKHIKAHKAGIEKNLKAYKCKMCPNTYFHSSSLSKHIVKTHIQMKPN